MQSSTMFPRAMFRTSLSSSSCRRHFRATAFLPTSAGGAAILRPVFFSSHRSPIQTQSQNQRVADQATVDVPLLVQNRQKGMVKEQVTYIAYGNAISRQGSAHARKSSNWAAFWNQDWKGKLSEKMTAHLLPRGYPSAVHTGYLPYSIWTAVSNLFGSITGVLSMEALLTAVGVGNSNVVPLAAALSWILREGIGQVGGIFYAARVGRVDASPKRTNFYSTWVLSASTLLELLTILAPAYFVLLGSVANVGKNVSCIACSATRAAINQSFSRYDNLADVTAKAASQSIVACTVGTGVGCLLLPVVGTTTTHIYVSFAVLSALQLYASYRSLRSVTFRTLNPVRLASVLNTFWHSQQPTPTSPTSSLPIPRPILLTPAQASAREEYVLPAFLSSSKAWIAKLPLVNPELDRLDVSSSHLNAQRERLHGEQFLLLLTESQRCVLLVMEEATSEDVFKGYVMGLRLNYELTRDSSLAAETAIDLAISYCTTELPRLKIDLESNGWDVKNHYLEPELNRFVIPTLATE